MIHPVVVKPTLSAIVGVLNPVAWAAGFTPSSDIPANAIYANGEAIPDPSGGGYLTYEV